MIPVARFALLLAATVHLNSQAILLEQNIEAASRLGLQALGELEFARGSETPDEAQVRGLVDELNEACIRASRPRVFLIAWSDLEYPTVGKRQHAPFQVRLAAKRADSVREKLDHDWQGGQGRMHFETVNMATRLGRADLKSMLEETGSAPSTELEVGLFAEYAQRRKLILWVDCLESKPDSGQAWKAPSRFVDLGRHASGLGV